MLKKLTKIYLLKMIVVLFFVLPIINLSAQELTGINTQGGGVTLTTTPANPKPNEEISITLNSYSVNVDSATIRWYINDVVKKEGIGEKVITTRTGKSGDFINVKVEVTTYDGRYFEKELSINPAEVDIIVEANSYTPPFYKGRAYFAPQGKVKIIAVPDIVVNGKKVENQVLSFKWKKNGMVLGNQSGTGRNTLMLEGEIPTKDILVGLEVLDVSRKVLASKLFVVSPQNPKILFYVNSSLYGVLLNKALLGNYEFGNREDITVIAKPYFFDVYTSGTTNFNYKWSVNNKAVFLNGNQNEVILKKEKTDSTGKMLVGLKIENQTKIFQYAENNFNLIF